MPNAPTLVTEHVFAAPRKWRADFAHVPTKVMIELDGGTWTRGRHVTGAGYAKDAEKCNEALLHGWAVFRLTSDMVQREPGRWCGVIADLIRGRSEESG